MLNYVINLEVSKTDEEPNCLILKNGEKEMTLHQKCDMAHDPKEWPEFGQDLIEELFHFFGVAK